MQTRALLFGGRGDGLCVRAGLFGDGADVLHVADDILHIVRRVINCLADLLDVGAHIIEALLDGGKALFRFDGDFLACLDFLLGVRDCARRELNAVDHLSDRLLDFIRRCRALLGKLADLLGDDCEAASCLTCARCLDGSVEREEIGLSGDFANGRDDILDGIGAGDELLGDP